MYDIVFTSNSASFISTTLQGIPFFLQKQEHPLSTQDFKKNAMYDNALILTISPFIITTLLEEADPLNKSTLYHWKKPMHDNAFILTRSPFFCAQLF